MVICHDRTSTIILNKHKHLDDWIILFSMEGMSESKSRKPKLELERKNDKTKKHPEVYGVLNTYLANG